MDGEERFDFAGERRVAGGGAVEQALARGALELERRMEQFVDLPPALRCHSSVPNLKFATKVPGGAPGSQGATTEHIGNM